MHGRFRDAVCALPRVGTIHGIDCANGIHAFACAENVFFVRVGTIHGIDCANGIHAFACAENVFFVLPRRQVSFLSRGFLPAVPGAGLFFFFSWSSRCPVAGLVGVEGAVVFVFACCLFSKLINLSRRTVSHALTRK
jgi:hypothetical protein